MKRLLAFWLLIPGLFVFSGAAFAQENFCATLNEVNSGSLHFDGLSDVEAHAKVLATLAAVAPSEISDDMNSLADLIHDWSQLGMEGSGLLGFFKKLRIYGVFSRLSDPDLAALEGRIASYIVTHCDTSVPATGYHVDKKIAQDPVCPAWPRLGSILSNNKFPNYLDSTGANYFANYFWAVPLIPAPPGFIKVERGGWVEFKAEYPRSRYFAYHPNDMDTNNLDTLQDRELDPDPGSVNPFREVPAKDSHNYYTARLMFTRQPANPQPNTSYVGYTKLGHINPIVMNLLRIYASDLGNGANTAGVMLPSVTVYDADGSVRKRFPPCDPYAEGTDRYKNDTRFPALPIYDHRGQDPLLWDASPNFSLSVDLLANADAQYFGTTLSHRFGEIYVLRGKALRTPNTRAGEPVSSTGKDVRMFTFCTYNFWAGMATGCLLDHELELDDNGYYTIVVSAEKDRPANLHQMHATWLDWGPYLDTRVSIRTVYHDNPKLQAIKNAMEGKPFDPTMAPYVLHGIPCTRHQFESGGIGSCNSTYHSVE